ncbi:AraC family transcriptional regulator [Rhizobium leucaenae]|uniref:AraC-like DNA-binding protein n=1 Tax=Rhizobium leucaenae TaxID=29450 RepID=A0A7W6ZV66_9HYPH|nr:AraC family transcriptional regulator [Rhizobium leucaenae]MBB4569366.1 AraC-like DNA-binding protein [Rhizobium leucaenae]MBB6302818.1 AraC-like DNA-binding protein [Rhizobium leucaenae]
MSVNSPVGANRGGISFGTETVHSGTDPDELSEILSTPRSPIKVAALDNSPIAFHCNFQSAGPVTVADCAYEGTVALKREAPSDKMIIFLAKQGNAVFNYPRKPIESAPGYGAILEGEPSTGSLLFGPRRHMALFIDKAKINGHLSHMLDKTVRGRIDIHPHFDLTSDAGRALLHLVEQLHHGLRESGSLRQSPLALASLSDAVTYLILENCQHRYSTELAKSAPAPAPRHVKWAIDFMQEHIAAPISLNDIATAANVSVRTLQQGFKQFRNTSPMTYLQEMRMAAVHHDLLVADTKRTVADVAAKWGFTHLGRFAAEYKKRFGHLPSQTLKA